MAKGKKNRDRGHGINELTAGMHVSDAAVEFGKAVEAWKKKYRRQFPSWSDVLEIARSLGYRKVAEPEPKG